MLSRNIICLRIRNCGKAGYFLVGVMSSVLTFVLYHQITNNIPVMARSRSIPVLDGSQETVVLPSVTISAVEHVHLQTEQINRIESEDKYVKKHDKQKKSQNNQETVGNQTKHVKKHHRDAMADDTYAVQRSNAFQNAVLEFVSPETNTIVLSSGDSGFLDMAINLYKTSFVKWKISNHLFVGSDDKFCDVLLTYGAHCVQYIHLNHSEQASSFNTEDFMRKSYMKVKVVMDALKLNVTVLFVDLDIVFLQNPLLSVTCDKCDLVIQSDGFPDNLNTGFYMIKPTTAAHVLMKRAWAKMDFAKPGKQNDQRILNIILVDMRKNNVIRQETLDMDTYSYGVLFFKEGGRVFKGDNPCTNCVMVHNNGIYSKEAKRFRFKEYGLWDVDQHGYYSDIERKYLKYDNPVIFGNPETTKAREYRALRTALTIGNILNRTVILPTFHDAEGHIASLLCAVSLPYLDQYMADAYREHVFLQHPSVPYRTKHNHTPKYLLRYQIASNKTNVSPDVAVKLFSKAEVQVREIQMWFEHTKASLLNFHSLYFDVAVDNSTEQFVSLMNKGLRRI